MTSLFRFFNRTLAGRILRAIILYGILPFVLVSALLVFLQSRSLITAAEIQLQERAFDYSQNLNVYIDELQRDAAAIAQLIPIAELSAEQQTAYLQRINAEYPEYGQVAYIGLDSYIQAASKPIELVSIAQIESFQTAATGRQDWVIAPALFNPVLVMHMHTPVFQGETLAGVFGSPVPLPRLVEIVTTGSVEVENRTQTTYVVDELGRILLHPDPEYVAGSLTANWFDAVPAEPSTFQYAENGVDYLVAVSPIPDLGWTMVVKWPYAEVIEPAVYARQIDLIALGVSILLSLAGAVFMSRTLTRPLRELVQAAREFGLGNAEAPLPDASDSGEEIGVLVETFGEMRHSISQTVTALESSIDREQGLSQALATSLDREHELSTLRSRILHTVSHEFRTPLAIIKNSSGLLIKHYEKLTGEKRQRHLAHINTATNRLTELMQDVELVGDANAVQFEAAPTSMPLNEFCKQVGQDLTMSMRDPDRLQMILDPSIGSDLIQIDISVVNQICRSLIDNALKFSADAVVTTFAADNNMLKIRVSDSGIGIPTVDQDRIFELMERGSNAETISGLGLGLYMAQQLAELIDATITVSSLGEAQGSTFEVNLPR